MNVAVDFRITYNNDKALRMFTREFWQDMAIARPGHQFLFLVNENQVLPQPAGNVQIRRLKKLNIGWIDQMRLKNTLAAWPAERLVTLHQAGFTISHLQTGQNKNGLEENKKQVLIAGSYGSGTSTAGSTTITPALREVITSLTWTETESIKTQYTGGRSFFLFTGDIAGQNQLIELLKAFSAFKKWQQSNMQLVIAGSSTAWTRVLEEKIITYKYKQDIVLLKNISNAEIAKLVAACYAIVYPSATDVFPFALLWGLQSNKAVIATANAVNRQVTEAALWVEPGDTAEGFAKAMILLFKDEQQQQLLVQQAREQWGGYNRRQMLAAAWRCIEQ